MNKITTDMAGIAIGGLFMALLALLVLAFDCFDDRPWGDS